MTTKEILVKAKAEFDAGAADYIVAVVNVLKPFKAGDGAQHNGYINAVVAVEEALVARKKNNDGRPEPLNTYIRRLPDTSNRQKWAAGFDKAIKEAADASS